MKQHVCNIMCDEWCPLTISENAAAIDDLTELARTRWPAARVSWFEASNGWCMTLNTGAGAESSATRALFRDAAIALIEHVVAMDAP